MNRTPFNIRETTQLIGRSMIPTGTIVTFIINVILAVVNVLKTSVQWRQMVIVNTKGTCSISVLLTEWHVRDTCCIVSRKVIVWWTGLAFGVIVDGTVLNVGVTCHVIVRSMEQRVAVLALSVSVVCAMKNVLITAQTVAGGMESTHTSETNLIGIGLTFFNVPKTSQICGWSMISSYAACACCIGMSKTETDVLETSCVVGGRMEGWIAYGTFLIYVSFTI